MNAMAHKKTHPFSRLFLMVLGLCVFTLTMSHAESSKRFKSSLAQAPFKPAMIYVTGEQDSDRAFIEMARSGALRAKKELGIAFEEYRLPEDEDPTEFLRSVAEKGYSPIIAVGYQNVVPVLTLAEKFPKTHFTVIDGLVPPLYQNVQSIIFKDHEGAFLVGMIAAYTSKSNHIGFVGGMDVPLIRNFSLGYLQGAKFVRPNIQVSIDMVGDTAEAWSQPDVAYDLATKQYKNGIDVIFTAAGGSGLGVLRAADDAKALAIGVDTNQNALYPGHVLTSMVKRVDNAVFDAMKTSFKGDWQAGIKSLGLKESALDFAVDENNKNLITEELIEQVLITRERIINGLIEVEMYSPN